MKRLKAYILMFLPYCLACALGWLIFLAIAPDCDNIYTVLLGLFVADLVATVVVWLFGVAFRNSSFYDPYWSLIPWLIVLGLLFRFSLWSAATILFIGAFSVWSWRLTLNWAYTCRDIKTEDWRYVKYRAENKLVVWHIINFFGINLLPTLIVFAALIPAIFLIFSKTSVGVFGVLGALIILFGTVLEAVADITMHKFLKKTANDASLSVCDKGLYRYSRHPNYLGEMMVWVGVYISAVPFAAWAFFGAVSVIFLFVFISIPLSEKRQLSRRKDYADYKKSTRMLLPLPKFIKPRAR